ncbi:hypothetical protein OROGR_026934 [Orobanche gracilis]
MHIETIIDKQTSEMIAKNRLRLKVSVDVVKLCALQDLSELCQVLSKTEKAKDYYLVDRLVRLVLTLPVSTATTERAFSSMKIIKTRLRNKMEDEFLANSMLMYIEREIVQTFEVNSIIDEFELMKNRRAQLKIPKQST